ncbi:MAG: [acyl-carrier-protein] S-malonyltransferase [Verrucomicrobiales bacterium]|jgi:[acyl-carrier-protein] S-malonyltransferase
MSSPTSSFRRVVILFSGQGAQKVGMGKDLVEAFPAARKLFAEADEALSMDLTKVMFEGPEAELTRTSYCQPALYLHGFACLKLLRDRVDIDIAAAAGLSLGEFTAHASAGTFSFVDGLRLVAKRGQFMEQACEATEGSMAAMIGGDAVAVEKLAAQVGVDVANYNAPGQIVVSGAKSGVQQAIAGAKEAGIRMGKELKVAGAYHSSLMDSARVKLAAELASAEVMPPQFPVVSNVTAAAVSDPAEIRSTLEAQVTGSVRWSESMDGLLDAGNDLFIELGPGGVLAGLMGRIRKGTNVIGIHDVASLEAAVAALK